MVQTDSYQQRAQAMSIAMLTEMGAWSASTRHRALAHLPRLRARFGRVDVSVADDAVPRPPGRVGQVRYFGAHALRYAGRGLAVARLVSDQDALFVQRGLYALGPGVIVNALRGYRGRIVLDLDDAVFELSPLLAGKGPAARWLYGPQQTRALMRRADELVVSTGTLAELLPDPAPAPTILPTVPDVDRYPIVEHGDERPVTVGWAGTVGGLEYLKPLAPVFARLWRDRVARLEVVSSKPLAASWASFRPWRLEDETALFCDFAIGIMPLPDTPYTRAKAGFKLLQYMAAGVPVVASPVGVNPELVRESGAGFVAHDASEWELALRTLAGDPGLRRELGARGRRFAQGYADLDAQAAVLAGLLAGRPG